MANPESTRTCSVCAETKLSELFAPHSNKCKPCWTAYRRKFYQRYRENNRERERLRVLLKARRLRGSVGYQRPSDPLKDQARAFVSTAVRRGRLLKPTLCPKCGLPGRIEAHHEDYSKPLQVEWLCSLCHGKHHRK